MKHLWKGARLHHFALLILPVSLFFSPSRPCYAQKAFSWGNNSFGQLGNGSYNSSSVPVYVSTSGVLNGKTVTQVAAGFDGALALCSDGTLVAWGEGSNGELGNGSTNSSTVPVLVARSAAYGSRTVTQISAGGDHCLALCSDGTLLAWGNNADGQLGNGNYTNSSVPILVSRSGVLSGKTVTKISAGGAHSLALCSDGTLASWGQNASGQLGNGSTAGSFLPVLVGRTTALYGKTVTQISAGAYHSLALCSDGTLASWGKNQYGQLGNGSTTNSSVPVRAGTPTNVTQISAGDDHSLALSSNSTLYSWGGNASGELGNGGTTDSSVPVQVNRSGVLSGKTVTQIALGGRFCLALCSDGTLVAWGNNVSGRLGNGGTTNSSVPVLVNTTGVLKSGVKLMQNGVGSQESLVVGLPNGTAASSSGSVVVSDSGVTKLGLG